MELILWRHAEAEDGHDDLARCLTAKGHHQAEKMAQWLSSRLPSDHTVLVSQAVRAQQTAAALSPRAKVVPGLNPGAGVASVLAAAGWPDAAGVVVVVGHQPALGEVASFLLAGEVSSWTIKKGAVWWISNRVRFEENQTLLRAVMGPDLV